MNDVSFQPGEFDLAICIGSTHAFGSGEAAFPNAIERLSRAVRPGGQLLIGEGYWKQEPAAEYLKLVGEPVGIYRDHAANISFAEQRGLIPLYARVSSEDEWDDFELSHHQKVQRLADANPNDPTAAERLARRGNGAKVTCDGDDRRWASAYTFFARLSLRRDQNRML